MTDHLVRIERHDPEGHVAELVLDRPDALNALSTAMAEQITAACAELTALGRTGEVRAVVVTSASEKAFCVGADLKERNGFDDAALRAQRPILGGCFRALHDVVVPVVVAVDGFALGGGFELALAGDLLVVGRSAVLGLPEVSVGVIPGGGGTQLLSRRVGLARAADLVLTARRITGEEAGRIGAASTVVDDGAARERALEIGATVAGHSPVGVRNAKRALHVGFDLPLAEGLAVEDEGWHATAFSADRAEGVAAFVEKRTPRWPGR